MKRGLEYILLITLFIGSTFGKIVPNKNNSTGNGILVKF
jgi:hypothetical protein